MAGMALGTIVFLVFLASFILGRIARVGTDLPPRRRVKKPLVQEPATSPVAPIGPPLRKVDV